LRRCTADMRWLQRPPYAVPSMAENGRAGRCRAEDCRKYEESGLVPAKFADFWTNADVKGLLHAMQGKICAYCGVSTDGLDVDHFRPKGRLSDDPNHSGYWWLAYDCSNYLLGCTVCNQKRKRSSFPIRRGSIRCTYETRASIREERRVLLDPSDDPVEEWLTI